MSFIWVCSIPIIIIVSLSACKSLLFSKNQGQDANLKFPYPCDGSEVHLQLWHNAPFYRSTENSLQSLPQDQLQRFNVQNRNESGNCYLDLQINDLKIIDEGTYISTVYKDGQVLDDFTAIRLQVDYPPGQVTCVEDREIAADWVLVNCVADAGSLPGKIECYQGGERVPPLTSPNETESLLKQTVLIRKSEPAFCCSCTLDEYKSRCECNDTVLFQADGGRQDPCPASSQVTTRPNNHSTLMENDQIYWFPTVNSSSITYSTPIIKCNSKLYKLITLPVLSLSVLLNFLCACIMIRMKIRYLKIKNSRPKDPPEPVSTEELLS
ncbi:uncharacterized protein LOC121422700 [Lytechinus variegatus]|uniref:uncharacterized protein LOC121422699 n=1 Tax=Lytechinus variegatus TaxID=7654 RepID=UPI001BB206A5|nr:uncharacterized protein LOC121422699 [Lytechinus variegatus]XP_041473801.1 uncharacterized protein LOC121422700 [Lytechinus variegatus]